MNRMLEHYYAVYLKLLRLDSFKGHSGRPGKRGGSLPREVKDVIIENGIQNPRLRKIGKKEKAKVTHDINNVYNSKYKNAVGDVMIHKSHSERDIDPKGGAYIFRNNGFNDYEIIGRIDIVGNEDVIRAFEREL